MTLTRARALALLTAVAALPNCAGKSNGVTIGSKNFTESFLVAEIYAQALEAAGYRVTRRMNLGSTQIALAALQRGEIDCYPEYTGTALIDVLHHAPLNDSAQVFDIVNRAFSQQFHARWLQAAPMNDSQGLATTPEIAKRYDLRTLSDLAQKAPQLRLATIPEFLTRPDGIPGLQKRYGGFAFKSVRSYDIALKYQALLDGQADIATAFTTDAAIAASHLTVLEDDKHLWPPYHVAPVVREARAADRKLSGILNRVSAQITTDAAQRMNLAVEQDKKDPADVAAAFLKTLPA